MAEDEGGCQALLDLEARIYERIDSLVAKQIRDRQRIDFVDLQQRVRAVNLLLVGSVSGFLGFLFATFLGVWAFLQPVELNYLGEPFASGHNYFPQTVSEMVFDPKSPSGKCFFAFCLIGAICILASWYPWELKNVWVGDDPLFPEIFPGRIHRLPTWPNLRQFLPPIGMMLVACIPTTKAANETALDRVTVLIHTAGAVGMLLGYCVVEIVTLKKAPHLSHMHVSMDEARTRWVFVILCLACCLLFQMFGLLASHADDLQICCMDSYVVPTLEDASRANGNGTHYDIYHQDLMAASAGFKLLNNTASGFGLTVKASEYFFECLAGIFMICSHLAVWYYARERKVNMDEGMMDSLVPRSSVELS